VFKVHYIVYNLDCIHDKLNIIITIKTLIYNHTLMKEFLIRKHTFSKM
jgi:hypothetical protein